MKSQLDYYGAGYQKGQMHAGALSFLAIILLALAILLDPLGLSGVGTYTDTGSYLRCDTGLTDGEGRLVGYFCEKAHETYTYGHPGAFAALFYMAIVLGGVLIVLILLAPRHAMDKLAHKLAAAKTLGLLEDDKE